MKTAVLINCYNYEVYVSEAIRSVADQIIRPDELIVVDDGSTDNSAVVAENAVAEIGFGRVVRQQNGGQLSAFQRGIQETDADWVFFLDADDRLKKNHIEVFLSYIQQNPTVSFFFSDVEEFGSDHAKAYHFPGPDGMLGSFGILAMCNVRWRDGCVGGVTSTLCIRRTALDTIFPFRRFILDDWKICADSALMQATSALGCLKYKIPEVTVDYRIHSANAFAGQEGDRHAWFQNALRMERLLGDVCSKCPPPPNFQCSLGLEYLSLPRKHPYFRRMYWRASCFIKVSFLTRLKIWRQLFLADSFK